MDNDDGKLLLENLTPANIFNIAWRIREKEHDPQDARRLLYKYCDLFDKGELIPPELLRHIRDSFSAYLSSGCDLQTALGLTPGSKRSGIDDPMAKDIAIDIWKRRLSGESHQVALGHAADVYGWGKTRTSEVWRDHSWDAFFQYRIMLAEEGKKLIDESGLKVYSAITLQEAADLVKKLV